MKPNATTDRPAPKTPPFSCPCGATFSTPMAQIRHMAKCDKAG